MSMPISRELSFRLKTQRALTVLVLCTMAMVGWYFLIESEASMRAMDGEGFMLALMWAMMEPSAAAPYLGATALMWVVMMLAMMVPAVMPMLTVFRRLDRAGGEADTFMFASGYLLAWSGFSIVAAILQWWLHDSGWLNGHQLVAGPLIAAAILVAAGIYQLTPLKEACLDKCRSPMGFFLANWREGRRGALRMGLHHGLFCIGCCWVLMLIMFVGGAMSVITMAALSVFIVAERVLPAGPWVARIPGLGLIGWGCYLGLVG